MDALYFRVSTDRQTTQNQFQDLLQVAERDGSGRNWTQVRDLLSRSIVEEQTGPPGSTRTVYRVYPQIVEQLADLSIYVEQGRSSRKGARTRPHFQQLKKDAALRKFDRLLVWKVSRLGRDMREVISTVYELADIGVTVLPIKSQTGPITSAMGKLLWAIQACFAEMENEERAEAIKAGQARAIANGKKVGRPKVIFDRDAVVGLRDEEVLSWSEIAKKLGVSAGTARRVYKAARASEPGVSPNGTG
jgi:DNA invertase Pin-like site-specific DNA recombinase